MPAPAFAAPDAAAGDSLDAAIGRCFSLRRSEPGAAISLARDLLARHGLQPDARIKLLSCQGMASALAGDAPGAIATVDEAQRLLKAHPMPPEFNLRALSNAGATLHIAGQVHRALDFYGRAYEAAREDESELAQISSLINVGIVHSEELGSFAVAESHFARAQALSDASGERDPLLPYNRALNHVRAGNDARALDEFAVAIRLARQAGTGMVVQRAEAERLALLARRGQAPDARVRLQAIADAQRESQDPSGASATLVLASRLALAAGDAKTALAQADSAAALARSGSFRGEIRQAMRAQVEAHRAQGQYREALETMTRLRDTEVGALQAQNIEGLADLQARLQDARSMSELERLRGERRIQALTLTSTRQLRNWAIVAFCGLALLSLAFVLYQRRVQRRLQLLSTTDALTGLLNRRAASAQLQALPTVMDAGSDARAVAFLIDIDHFKSSNDRHGHAAGDAILVEVALRLRACCRPGDVVARWGGEEFLIACAALDLAHASAVAERIRSAVRQTPLGVGASGAGQMLSVSVGFACWPFFPSSAASARGGWQEAVSVADRAMYAAKHSGRDAWAGLWGSPGRTADIAAVLRDPAQHVQNGNVTMAASRLPIAWEARVPAEAA